MRFAQHFGLNHDQAELDFVDIDVDQDLPLFFDPYVFAVRDDAWSRKCNEDIVSFFQTAIACIQAEDHARGRRLFTHLHEPNETCLGWSRGRPRGRGIGHQQAEQIYDALAASEAARTGMLSDLSECELFIVGIGSDKISDITTNIIRHHLIEYTNDQCQLHGIIDLQERPSGSLWDSQRHEWTQGYVRLPIVNGRKVILVPKAFVRWPTDLSHQHQKYYRHFVLNFLQEHHLDTHSGLVHLLKNGTRRVYKTELQERYPLDKDFLFRFSRDNPAVLARYKQAMSRSRPVHSEELDEEFDEAVLADVLIQHLGEIEPGPDSADRFHNYMIGALEFIFYPNLLNPKKEQPIHEGRKRIDIGYTNAAEEGLFKRLHTYHNITCILVMVECKNVSSDPTNPELDQLLGRFGANRGRFGILVARSFIDRDLFIARCRDTARDSNGYILPLVDRDIVNLLECIRDGRRRQIDEYLDNIFRELLQ